MENFKKVFQTPDSNSESKEVRPRSKFRDAAIILALIVVGEAVLLVTALAIGKENFNLYGLLGFPFGVLFLVNGLWEDSPFALSAFRKIQEERLGAEGLMLRMVITGIAVLIISALAFLKVIF